MVFPCASIQYSHPQSTVAKVCLRGPAKETRLGSEGRKEHLQPSDRQSGGLLAIRKAVFLSKQSETSEEARNEPTTPAYFQMPDTQTKRKEFFLSNSDDCKDDTVAQEVFVVTLLQNLVDLNRCPEHHPKSARQPGQASRRTCSQQPHPHILHFCFMTMFFFSEFQLCFGEPIAANSQGPPASKQSLNTRTVETDHSSWHL